MIAAPFCYVGFADFWLADQLNSLAVALLDFQFLTCFYLTNGNWLQAGGKYNEQLTNVSKYFFRYQAII